MDTETSLLKRIKRRKNGNRKIDEDKDVDTTLDEDKDIDTTELHETKPNHHSHDGCNFTFVRRQIQDGEDPVVIPDTPSPVFSKFVGKRFRKDVQREAVNESQIGSLPQSKARLKFNHKEEFKKPQRIQQVSKSAENCMSFLRRPGYATDEGHVAKTSSVNKSSPTCCSTKTSGELSPQERFFERVSQHCQNDANRIESMISEDQEETRRNALIKIKTIREKKKATAKRFFDNLYELNENPNSQAANLAWTSSGREMGDSVTDNKSNPSKQKNLNEIDEQYVKAEQDKKRKKIQNRQNLEVTDQTVVKKNNPFSLPRSRITDHNDKKSVESANITFTVERLRAEHDKKRSRIDGERTDNKNIVQNNTKPCVRSSFPYQDLLWPSDSDSDSDILDSVPLREILNSNRDVTNVTSDRNSIADSEEKNSKIGQRTGSELSENEIGATGGVDLSIPKDNSCSYKSRNDVRNFRDNCTPESVISISSNESLNEEELEQLMANPFSPETNNDASFFARAVQQYAQSFGHQERQQNITPRLCGRGSMHHRHGRTRGEFIDDVLDLSDSLTPNSVPQGSQLSSGSNGSRGDKSKHPFTGSKRNRCTGSSQKGRPVRSRSGSRQNQNRASGFFPASALLLSAEERDHSQREGEIVKMVEQLEGDEEYARKLQEEMDLEFAMTLQNMENQPPRFERPLVPEESGYSNNFHPRSGIPPRGPSTRSGISHLPGLEDPLTTSDSEESMSLEHTFPATSPRPPRTRSRVSPAYANWQRLHGNTSDLVRMENHLLALGQDFPEPQILRGRRLGRRGTYFPNIAVFRSPGVDGNDYEDLLNLAEMLGDVKKRGLTQVQASRLPERKFIATSSPEDNTECMICMCEYEANDKLRKLPCFHEFHSSCIDKWIMGNATCPICRVEVRI